MIRRAFDWIKTFLDDVSSLSEDDVFNIAMQCHGGIDDVDLEIMKITRMEHEKRWADYHLRWVNRQINR